MPLNSPLTVSVPKGSVQVRCVPAHCIVLTLLDFTCVCQSNPFDSHVCVCASRLLVRHVMPLAMCCASSGTSRNESELPSAPTSPPLSPPPGSTSLSS